MIKKFVGYIVLVVYGTLIAILAVPIILPGVMFWGFLKLSCWVNGKHKWPISAVLAGTPLPDARCITCMHIPNVTEQQQILEEAVALNAKLLQAHDLLQEMYKTPEEKEVEKLIEETKKENK